MLKTNNRVMQFLSLASLTVLLSGTVISCSGGSSNKTNTTTTTVGAQASAVNGAVKLSATIGDSTDMASASIPNYAPGKSKAVDTSAIANIDPRLKQVVDKMMSRLANPVLKSELSKARLANKISYAPLSAPTSTNYTCATSGSYTVSSERTVTGTTITDNLQITFSNCKQYSENLNGTISGSYVTDSSNSLISSASLTMNLTDTIYDFYNPAVVAETFTLNGAFSNIDNYTSGSNSALGSFIWTIPSPSGNTVMSFNFGSGSTPVTDVWSDTNPEAMASTITHTGNGSFSLTASSPGIENFSLTLSLTNLTDKVTIDSSGNQSEWIDGAVSINWTPDLSALGCKAGTFTIATPLADPIYTPYDSWCPTDGTMTINGITITFGSTGSVTVFDSTGSITFNSCFEFDGSGQMCS